MPFLPLGTQLGVLRQGDNVAASRIQGGTITAQELILAGGTQGVFRSQNYDPTNETGWAIFGDGSASFYGDLTIGADAIVLGDVYSSNWDGAIPANLSSAIDSTATTGYYFDSSSGVGQVQELYVAGDSGGYMHLQPYANVGSLSIYIDELNFESIITSAILDLGGDQRGTLSLSPAYDSGSRSELTLFSGSSGADNYAPYVSVTTFDYMVFPAGSASAPSITFNADTDTGIYWSGANKIGFAIGGTNYFEMAGGYFRAVNSGGGALRYNGSSSVPAVTFTNDTNTGFSNPVSDEIWFIVGGTTLMRLDGGLGQLLMQNTGAQGRPEYGFWDDTDTGMALQATGQGILVAGGLLGIEWHSNNVYLWGARNNTTGSSPNTLIQAADGRIFRTTSALKYKSELEDAAHLADIELKPQKFYREDDEAYYYGLIADWLTDQDPLLGEYGDDGEVENYDQRAVLAVLAAKVNRLEEQERRIQQLESTIQNMVG